MARDLSDLLAADEGVVLETRQHWFVVLRSVAVLLLLLVLDAVAIWYAGEAGWLDNRVGGWVTVALWIAFGAMFVLVAWRFLQWATERIYVTTNKVVYAHGVFNRNVVSTPLVKIDEMTLRRPLLGRVLGFGRLDVDNAAGGAEPLAGLEYLPRPVRLYQMIGERSRHQRMVEGGVHRDRDADGLVDPEREPEPIPAEQSWRPGGDATS